MPVSSSLLLYALSFQYLQYNTVLTLLEDYTTKHVQQRQAFFVRACSTNPEVLVIDYQYHKCGCHLSLLTSSNSVNAHIKRWVLCVIWFFFCTKWTNASFSIHHGKKQHSCCKESKREQCQKVVDCEKSSRLYVYNQYIHSCVCYFISNFTNAHCNKL